MARRRMQIPEEDLEKIAELFQESDAATTKLSQLMKEYVPDEKPASNNIIPVGLVVSAMLGAFSFAFKIYDTYNENQFEIREKFSEVMRRLSTIEEVLNIKPVSNPKKNEEQE